MEPAPPTYSSFNLFILICIVIIAANLGFLNYNFYQQSAQQETDTAPPVTTIEQSECGDSCKNAIKTELAALIPPVPSATAVPTSTTTSTKIQNPTRPPSTPAPTSPRIFTVNIGAGQTAAGDWTDLPNLQTTVNTAQTGSIKSATFEVTLSIPNTKGIAYVRLFDLMENKTVPGTELTTTNGTPTVLTSQPFTIDRTKTYKIQMKSSETQNAVLDQSKINLVLN